MKSPFIISFKKKLQEKNKEEIFDLFLTNISGTHYDKIERENDSKLIIKGSFFQAKRPFEGLYNIIVSLWERFCRKAELYFAKNNDIIYSVDYTYGVVWLFIILVASILPALFFSLKINVYYYIGFVTLILALEISSIVFRLYLHRQVFAKTLRNENLFKGSYDWDKVLKSKTDNELKNIVNGNTILTIEVQKMAKEELNRRKIKKNWLQQLAL